MLKRLFLALASPMTRSIGLFLWAMGLIVAVMGAYGRVVRQRAEDKARAKQDRAVKRTMERTLNAPRFDDAEIARDFIDADLERLRR